MPSPSINLIKASDGTGNAAMATVQSTRAPLATTLIVNTVDNIPSTFIGTMGTPHTFVDPITAEEIVVISEATAVDFTGHVDGTNLEIDAIADGYTDLGSAANDVIIIKPTTEWANNVADVLDVAHDDDGTLADGAVHSAAVLASDVVTNAKLSTTAGELGGTWTSYTATMTNLPTSSKVTRYTRIGKTIHLTGLLIASGAGTGTFNISLPFAAASSSSAYVGSAWALDSGTAYYTGVVKIISGGSVADFTSNATVNQWGTLIPHTWANNDQISFSITYETA